MLNAQTDRMDYRELLAPPQGYKIEFIVGTTYSLDLETLTAACAIVGLNVEADTQILESPLHMLEAIRRASGKLLIFCQSGQIYVPGKPNRLLPLLENSVSEVIPKEKRSFHPKTWFIKYSAGRLPDRYRLVVASRNLTFDRSWDVALRLDSSAGGEPCIKQEAGTGGAIKAFLLWLTDSVNPHTPELKTKRKHLLQMAEELSRVKWQSPGKEYDSFDFIPFGIGLNSTGSLMDKFNKMFIITPFLSRSVIDGFAKNRLKDPDCTLITRITELPKLDTELLTAFETYTVKDDVVDGEERISDSGGYKKQDIHAKVYLRTKWSDSELYIGSANASYSAFEGGNVECMAVLRAKQRYLNVERLKKDLFGEDEKANPFVRAKIMEYKVSDEDAVLITLEKEIRKFCAGRMSAAVTGSGPFVVTVTLKPFKSDAKLTLSPLMKPVNQPLSGSMTFSGLALRELSEWYTVTAAKGKDKVSRVVKIKTSGIPEERDAAVFTGIVHDKNAFLTYIAFLLSDDCLEAYLESTKKGDGGYSYLNMNFDAPILYERMLRAAADSPEDLRGIRNIIERLSKLKGDVVPEGFAQLYGQFEKAVK